VKGQGFSRVVNAMANLLDLLFGCSHKSLSFPMTRRRGQNAAAAGPGIYVVCLDCGREFAYDWQRMKILDSPAGSAKGLRAKPAKAA
jgi:hypothetical protein